MSSTPRLPPTIRPRRSAYLALPLLAFAAAIAAGADSPISRPPTLERDVQFWTHVYTEVTTNEGVLHDEFNLGVVYEILHFAPNATPREREQMVENARDRYVGALRGLAAALKAGRVPVPSARAAAPAVSASDSAAATSPPPDAPAAESAAAAPAVDGLTADEQRMREMWAAEGSAARLLQAVDGIRFQLGQADRFRAGLVRSGAWEAHIAETLANLGLPPEIAALPHVESSFNPAAYSKVGAAGLWQFMRGTGRRYLRIDSAVDERLDPFRSTEAAAQLLAYNYRILGSWPLAITAYNHGAGGMRHARDSMGTEDIALIVRNYRSSTFGFASRNFYVSFLAALSIMQNPEKYFGSIERVPEQHFREISTPAFVPVAALERALKINREQLRSLNPALQDPVWNGQRLVPRGYQLRLPQDLDGWTSERLTARLAPSEQFVAQIESRSYRVHRGETLAQIAAKYGLAPQLLAKLNGLGADASVRAGRALRLPERQPALVAAAAGKAALAEATVSESAAAEHVYVVRGGDSLTDIAGRVGLKEAQLMSFNQLRDPNFIFEGQRLRLTAAPPQSDDSEPAAATAPVAARDNTVASVGATPAGKVAAGSSAAANAGAALVNNVATSPAPPSVAPAAAAARANVRVAAVEPAIDAVERDVPLPGTSGPHSRRLAVASHAAEPAEPAASPEPVSKAEAEAISPSVGPSIEAQSTADPVDYSIAHDGTIGVAAAETLGHYADWLGISAARLRQLNHLRFGRPVLLGQRIKLDLGHGTREAFEEHRREYHAKLQADFFAAHRIYGTEIYIARRGDSLWTVTQGHPNLPVWLLQQYNPDVDFADMRPGTQIVVPRLEEVASGA
ncbi:MAG TPA: LysM peptidoglycan-binding domain-containing protein [Steroidobacteraceae bacterium]